MFTNVTLLSPPRSFTPKLGLGDPWVRQFRSGSNNYPTAATKCNVQRDNPSKNNSHQFESLSSNQGAFVPLYIPPFSHSPVNGKPHLHTPTFTTVTLLYASTSEQSSFETKVLWLASTPYQSLGHPIFGLAARLESAVCQTGPHIDFKK